MDEVEDPILYVTPDTMDRLVASERASVREIRGFARFILNETDHRYPGVMLITSRQVTGNAVHRKTWVSSEQRYIYEYVGDI